MALVDRLVHRADVVGIKGESYRQKEAQEHSKARAGKRKTSKWTPEQDLALWELLDDLRDRVGTNYGLVIQNLMREQRVTHQPLDDFD